MTASSNLTCDELIDVMDALNVAWMNCGAPEGATLEVLLRWESIDGAVTDGEAEAADLMIRTAEALSPGLLAAAHSYANHIEAGQPDYDQQHFIRRLFAAKMGHDPFPA